MATLEWNEENTRIVTELFADEVGRGNRPNNHLNSVGYDEVSERFRDRTGLDLKKTQLKNTWDKLKTDYTIWKKLLQKQTGAGWDNERGTIKQDNEWWKKAKADIPGCGKFQKQGIRNEDNLRKMFGDITNDGTDHWNPTMGNTPEPTNPLVDVVNIEAEDENDIDIDAQESPDSSACKRKGKVVDDKSKKAKTSQVLQDEIKKMGVLAERTQSTLESYTKKDEASSVNAVMDLVIECGAGYGSDEYFIATELFVKREQREMFLHMPTPEIRLEWLRRKHNTKYGR